MTVSIAGDDGGPVGVRGVEGGDVGFAGGEHFLDFAETLLGVGGRAWSPGSR